MMPFKRHDTAALSIFAALFVGGAVLALGLGTPGWDWRGQAPWAAVLGLAAGATPVWLRRGFPPDVPLVWIGTEETKRLLASPPPPDRALLSVALRRSWGSRYRLEVFVDDVRLGQLRPGTGFLVPVRPGSRTLTIFNGTRRTSVRERFEAVAGGRAGFVVRSYVGRSTVIIVMPAMVDLHGMYEVRLLAPLTMDA